MPDGGSDAESRSGANRGELTIQAEADCLGADKSQRVLAPDRADRGGAPPDDCSGPSEADVLAEPLFERPQPLGPFVDELPRRDRDIVARVLGGHDRNDADHRRLDADLRRTNSRFVLRGYSWGEHRDRAHDGNCRYGTHRLGTLQIARPG